MSYDSQDYRSDHPKYETVSEPKYKTLEFTGEIEDDIEDWCKYKFSGDYYEHDNRLRFVKLELSSLKTGSWFLVISDPDEWHWILKAAIAEELGIEEDAIIFECRITQSDALNR